MFSPRMKAARSLLRADLDAIETISSGDLAQRGWKTATEAFGPNAKPEGIHKFLMFKELPGVEGQFASIKGFMGIPNGGDAYQYGNAYSSAHRPTLNSNVVDIHTPATFREDGLLVNRGIFETDNIYSQEHDWANFHNWDNLSQEVRLEAGRISGALTPEQAYVLEQKKMGEEQAKRYIPKLIAERQVAPQPSAPQSPVTKSADPFPTAASVQAHPNVKLSEGGAVRLTPTTIEQRLEEQVLKIRTDAMNIGDPLGKGPTVINPNTSTTALSTEVKTGPMEGQVIMPGGTAGYGAKKVPPIFDTAETVQQAASNAPNATGSTGSDPGGLGGGRGGSGGSGGSGLGGSAPFAPRLDRIGAGFWNVALPGIIGGVAGGMSTGSFAGVFAGAGLGMVGGHYGSRPGRDKLRSYPRFDSFSKSTAEAIGQGMRPSAAVQIATATGIGLTTGVGLGLAKGIGSKVMSTSRYNRQNRE